MNMIVLSKIIYLALLLRRLAWSAWAEVSNSSLAVSDTSLAEAFRPIILENLKFTNIPNPTRWPEAGNTVHLYLTVIRKAWTSTNGPIQTSSYDDLVSGMRLQLIVIPGATFTMEQLGWTCLTMLEWGLSNPISLDSPTCAISRWSVSRLRDGKVLGQVRVVWGPEAAKALPETPAILKGGRNASTDASAGHSSNDTFLLPPALSAQIATRIRISSSGHRAPTLIALRLITKMVACNIVTRDDEKEARDLFVLGQTISVAENGYQLSIKFQDFMPEGIKLNMGHVEEVLRALTLKSELRSSPVTFTATAYAWNTGNGVPGSPFITLCFQKSDNLPPTGAMVS